MMLATLVPTFEAGKKWALGITLSPFVGTFNRIMPAPPEAKTTKDFSTQ